PGKPKPCIKTPASKGHSDRGIFGAAAKGCLSELEKTLKDNDINALNSSRETLLHVAATNGHLAIMEYLISKGAKPDVKDKKGRTPLHRAAEKGHGDAVKVLLRCGASMYSLDKEGKMPLHVAAQNSHGHILKVLLREEYTPLLLACETGKAEGVVGPQNFATRVLLSSGHYWVLH
uniref:Ankyrin n=1 Tax=Anser cygnoides TaxID=8845 RepID=A0A8B9ENS1_ANSCY